MFVAVFEREFGDAGFVELTEPFGYHAIVLFLRRAGEQQVEEDIARELERDPAIFGCVCSGEKAVWSRFCMSSRSVSSTREFAPVCENASRNIVRSRRSAEPNPRLSARPAVLKFITMFTNGFTLAPTVFSTSRSSHPRFTRSWKKSPSPKSTEN